MGPGWCNIVSITRTEQVEYLFTRVRAKRDKMDFENYAFEHVLSYQRRIQATKEQFMRRNKKTPLGIIQDWWLIGRRWGTTLIEGKLGELLGWH